MNTASCYFRLCQQRQLVSGLAASQRTARNVAQQRSRQFSNVRSCFARPVDDDGSSEARPEESLPSNTISTARNDPLFSETAEATLGPVLSKRDEEFLQRSKPMTGTVVRTGTMKQTVAVRTDRQHFDKFLKAHYMKASKNLVHDPHDTLVEGDVIKYGFFPPEQRVARAKRGKKNVRFFLREVVTPFGLPMNKRTPKITIPQSVPLASTVGSSAKQRRSSGIRGYAVQAGRPRTEHFYHSERNTSFVDNDSIALLEGTVSRATGDYNGPVQRES